MEGHGWQFEVGAGPLLGPLLMGLILIVPFWRAYKRAGLTPYYALLVFLPFFGILAAVGVLALSRWPRLPGR